MNNEVTCLDLTNGKVFTKVFNDIDKQRRFLIRCKYSKKLMVLGYTYNGREEEEYLNV